MNAERRELLLQLVQDLREDIAINAMFGQQMVDPMNAERRELLLQLVQDLREDIAINAIQAS